jgi:hypothetical protein
MADDAPEHHPPLLPHVVPLEDAKACGSAHGRQAHGIAAG